MMEAIFIQLLDSSMWWLFDRGLKTSMVGIRKEFRVHQGLYTKVICLHGKTIVLAYNISTSVIFFSGTPSTIFFIGYCLDLPLIGLQNNGGHLYSTTGFFHVLALEEIFLSSTVTRSEHGNS